MELGMNVIALVSTTTEILNLLLSLTGYNYARGGNSRCVKHTLSRTVNVPQGGRDRYCYNTQSYQVTVCRMSDNIIAKYS
jgi:hypothetical protein